MLVVPSQPADAGVAMSVRPGLVRGCGAVDLARRGELIAGAAAVAERAEVG